MERLLQQFETPFQDTDGETYTAFVLARPRPRTTWEGFLIFERQRDGQRFATGTETTQPTAEAVLYWATGLSAAYFEGALRRALNPASPRPTAEVGPPLYERGVDSATRAARLMRMERDILDAVQRQQDTRVLTQQLFRDLPYAHADIVRALESMEKERRLIVRQTDQGNDWVVLTEAGLRAAGLGDVPHEHDQAILDRPKTPR
jgi:hypothetical protein